MSVYYFALSFLSDEMKTPLRWVTYNSYPFFSVFSPFSIRVIIFFETLMKILSVFPTSSPSDHFSTFCFVYVGKSLKIKVGPLEFVSVLHFPPFNAYCKDLLWLHLWTQIQLVLTIVLPGQRCLSPSWYLSWLCVDR